MKFSLKFVKNNNKMAESAKCFALKMYVLGKMFARRGIM